MISKFLSKLKNSLELKRMYQQTFDLKKDCARYVLADIRDFCSPDIVAGTGNPIDPIALGIKIGREQVAKRIFEKLKINEIDIDNSILRGENYERTDY